MGCAVTYSQLDDHFDIHPKYEDFDLEHYGLQACAITHCNRHLTDGRISLAAVRKLGKAGPAKALRVASHLVAAGIWRAIDTGFEVVGFLDHNPSRAQVEKRRSETKARKEAWKERQERKPDASRNAFGTPFGTGPERPPTQTLSDPLPSDPLPEQRKIPPVGGTRGANGLKLEPPAKKPTTGKRPIPPDFAVTAAVEKMSRAEGLPNPHVVILGFRDWATANDRRYADWEAAFRNWMRSEITRKTFEPWEEVSPPKPPSAADPLRGPPSPEMAAKFAEQQARFEAEDKARTPFLGRPAFWTPKAKAAE
jgi:hypothetical protein